VEEPKMKYEGTSRRIKERLKIALPVRVQCRESVSKEWIEMTRLIDVTPFGARFTVVHLTEEGRLLHLTLPMPRNLRCFDHAEDQYRIWSIVRYVRIVAPTGSSPQRYDIGVAFIGKRPPSGYQEDPSKRYEVLAPANRTGMWEVREKSIFGDRRRPEEDRRSETRHSIPVSIKLETLNEKGEIANSEQTVTENITRRGASIFTSLDIPKGSFVRVTNIQTGMSVMAAVRAYRLGADHIPRLHVEFVDKNWHIEGIE
jgi:hypothetical protein